jgi:hypothetical protein
MTRSEPLRTAAAAPPRPTVTPRPPARIASPSIAPMPMTAPAAAPAPPPPATFAAPVAATPAPAEDERGWVSDLLRRASRDEEAPAEESSGDPAVLEMQAAAPAQEMNGAANGSTPPTPSSAEPLNALSVDIARAIDHDASVELWERHRRGERNLFTRRLYTLQGQQTFDEIRKKYQRDEEFRSAVDRYISDFEKLLAEVSRNSKDRNAGHAYLTSDTGKVYTMLAHASGRFD